MLNIISLGAGVQSSTMALMAAHGEIEPMPDAAIFADTQAEPENVYSWLEQLNVTIQPIPLYRVSKGNLGEADLIIRRSKKSGKLYRNQLIPAFTDMGGMYPRKCTRDYKILPIQQFLRRKYRIRRGENKPQITVWMGISIDEAHRTKDSRVNWIQHRYPLIEMGISRVDCLGWMKRNGYPEPPRSACVFCPYHSDDEWLKLSEDDFGRAVQFERLLQDANSKSETARGIPYLHNSREPLAWCKFDRKNKTDGFGNECEGMCGV